VQTRDESLLIDTLSQLSENARAAFAAACAERLMPYYVQYAKLFKKGDPAVLREGLDLVWEHALDRQPPVKGLQPLAARAMELAPGDGDKWTALNRLAENAAAAVYYCLECRMKGDTKNAVLASRQAYEAVDYLTQNIRHIQFGSRESEEAILRDRLVQDELSRQQRDLELLETGDLNHSALHVMKARAEREGTELLNATVADYLATIA